MPTILGVDIDPDKAIATGKDLYNKADAASKGDLMGMSAAGVALAKGLDTVGVQGAANAVMGIVAGASAGAAIGSVIPGLGTVVGSIIGAMAGVIQGVLTQGPLNPPQETRTHTAQKLVFPFDASAPTGSTEGWIRPPNATSNSLGAAQRIVSLAYGLNRRGLTSPLGATVPGGPGDIEDWNWLTTYLGGADNAALAMSRYLNWYGWNRGAPQNVAMMHWFTNQGITYPSPYIQPHSMPGETNEGACAILPDCSNPSQPWGKDVIAYPLAELAAVAASNEQALHYMVMMTWLWRHGNLIDNGLDNGHIPPEWARVIGNINAMIRASAPAPAPQPAVLKPKPKGPPPRVINLGQGSLKGLDTVVAKQLPQWVAFYLGEGKPPF